MDTPHRKYDDSGHCDFADHHNLVPIYDEAHCVGICCTFCGYVLYEHPSNILVTPSGEFIVMNESILSHRRKDRRF